MSRGGLSLGPKRRSPGHVRAAADSARYDSGELFGGVEGDPPGAELLELQAVDQERLAGPEARELAVGAGRARLGLGVGVEDGELVALVLEEPHLGVDLELVAVRRGEPVAAADVALGDAVAEDEHAAALVRRLLGGVGVQLGADRGRDYHQSVLSIDSSTSSALQKSPERYFQPPSASTATTTEPAGQLLGDPPRDVDDRSRGDAGEDPLAVEQRVHRGDRLGVRDEQLPVELRDVEDRRHVAVVERAQAHHRIAGQRLGRGDDDVGKRLAHPRARCPSASRRCRGRRRARRPAAGRARSRRRCPRSGRAGSTRSRTGRASCTADRAAAISCASRTAPLEPSLAGESTIVAPKSSSTSRRSGVAFAGITQVSLCPRSFATSASEMPVFPLVGSSSSRAGLEVRGVDHRERDPVLDRPGRVLRLELRVDRDALGRQVLESDERRVADQVEQRSGDHPPAIAGRRTIVAFSRTGASRPPLVRTSSPST